MLKLKKSCKAVSQVIGFVITFGIISLVTSSLIFTTSIIVERREIAATKVVAEDIVNYALNAIIDCSSIKQIYPNTASNVTVDIPTDINGNSYYIEATSNKIFINVTNGVSVNTSTLNQDLLTFYPQSPSLLDDVWGISGRVYCYNGELTVKSNSLNYMFVIE